MSIENELKLLPKQEINKQQLLKVLEEAGYEIQGELKLSKQEDTYYDTPEKEFYNNDSSLRIRKTGKGIFVTYKISIDSQEEYKQRNEYEVKIPDSHIKKDENVDINDAIYFLKQEYPELQIPENLSIVAQVNNNRQKVNVKAKDGTIIEIAFDDLHATDENGDYFKINNELESEVLSGNPDTLKDIHEIIASNYDVQVNELSKYKRSIKEMNEQKQNMTLDEITICAMLSDIIRTNEFEQLKYKGQIIHDYRVKLPSNLELTNFKYPKYLIRKISAMKRTKNYSPGKIKTLEDMFLCFFSDMGYQDIEYKLVNFLNENYYREDQAITNRMSHSQQVMLTSGLISRSKEIPEKDRNILLCMASGLVHDIGHVPGAHPTERLLGILDGFFSHEINGRDVIERIVSQDEMDILETIKKYTRSIGEEYSDEKILQTMQSNKNQIKKSIEAHSRTNSESRGDGTVVQLPREADKICYGVSDIVDVLKRTNQTGKQLPNGFFTKEWKETTIRKLGKGYAREELIKERIEEFEKLIRTENFGELITNIANTVRENRNDGRIYYDVEQDTWDILNSMIGYVKELRKEGVIDLNKREMQNAAVILIIIKFNEALAKNPNNIEVAWYETLRTITNTNDIEMLNMVNGILEQFKDDPEGLQAAFRKGGVLDTTELEKLDNADRQIKLKPDGVFQISEMLPFFGENYISLKPDRLRDTYFATEDKDVSICLRQYLTKQQQDLILKKKREKRSNASRKRKICNKRYTKHIIKRTN